MFKKAICLLLGLLTVCMCIPLSVGDSALSVTYVMPNERKEDALLDTDVMTRVTVKHGSNITMKLSHAGEGRTVYLEWFSIPEDAELQIAVTEFRKPDEYVSKVSLDANCVKAVLAAKKADCSVSSLFIKEGAPDAAYEWVDRPSSCDMLFIVPTPAQALSLPPATTTVSGESPSSWAISGSRVPVTSWLS